MNDVNRFSFEALEKLFPRITNSPIVILMMNEKTRHRQRMYWRDFTMFVTLSRGGDIPVEMQPILETMIIVFSLEFQFYFGASSSSSSCV